MSVLYTLINLISFYVLVKKSYLCRVVGWVMNYDSTPKIESIIMNNKYKITISDPLLRPGMKIETTCSEKYVSKVVSKIMEMVRQINESDKK